MKTVATVIAEELYDAGVRTVFGQPGGEVVDLLEALAQAGIEFVLMGHESAAAFAASTLGHATGVPGVCLATLGPGACNLTIGVGEALLDRAPLLAISARTPDRPEWYNHQRLDLDEMFRPITKEVVSLDGTGSAEKIQYALYAANTPPKGPVYISLPSNIATQPNEKPHYLIESIFDPFPTEADIFEAIADKLNRAQRPIAVVGIALDPHNDYKAVRRFLTASGIPYVDTPKAKGVIDPKDANYLGTCMSASGDRVLDEVLTASDCILGIGYDHVETAYKWHLSENYVGLANASTAFGDHFPLEAIGDLPTLLDQLGTQYDGTTTWSSAEKSAIRTAISDKITPDTSQTDAGIAPLTLAQAMQTQLPTDILLTVDTGQHKMLFGQAWHTAQPLSYFNSNGLSAMGTSVPGAIALAHHFRDKRIVSVSGDGGFAMMVQELETVKRLGVSPLFIVMADQALSLIRLPQQLRGFHSRGVDFGHVDWATVAHGFGVHGLWARTQSELDTALAAWVAQPQATVLAVQIDETLYRGNSY